MIIYASWWRYKRFVLQLSRLCAPNNKRCLAKLVTVTSVTMWPFWGRLVRNCFTSWESEENGRTLDSPNWEFAVTKLPVYLLQSPVFLSSKPESLQMPDMQAVAKESEWNVLLWILLTKSCSFLLRGYMVTLVTVTILSVTQRRYILFFRHLSHFWAKILYLKGFRKILPSPHLSHISPFISPITPPLVSLGPARRIPYYK